MAAGGSLWARRAANAARGAGLSTALGALKITTTTAGAAAAASPMAPRPAQMGAQVVLPNRLYFGADGKEHPTVAQLLRKIRASGSSPEMPSPILLKQLRGVSVAADAKPILDLNYPAAICVSDSLAALNVEKFDAIVREVLCLVAAGNVVYLHCVAGLERSALFVAACLLADKDSPLAEHTCEVALTYVQALGTQLHDPSNKALRDLLELWWQKYQSDYLPSLASAKSDECSGAAAAAGPGR